MKTMKKLFFSVCAASLLLFSACSKDDDEKNVSEMSTTEIKSLIVGTWDLTQMKYSETYEGEEDHGTETPEDLGLQGYIFNDDNTFTKILQEGGNEYPFNGSYRIEGSILTLTFYDDPHNELYTIERLTKNELILFETDEDESSEHSYYCEYRYYFEKK